MRKNAFKKLQPVQRKEREKTLLLARNIKIVQDLQGAMRPLWRCHGNLLLENRYLCFNHRCCAAIPFFSSLRADCGVHNKAGNQKQNHTGLHINSSLCRVESIGGHIESSQRNLHYIM